MKTAKPADALADSNERMPLFRRFRYSNWALLRPNVAEAMGVPA